MCEIMRSYNYHFVILPSEKINSLSFFNSPYSDCIFNNNVSVKYLEQGMCDFLQNKNGILFTQHVLQQFEPNQILNDFISCFAFNIPTYICDKEHSRYNKNYTFDFEIDELKKEVPMELILQYEDSPWKPILEIDPDFFYLKNNEEILIGSKDFKQVENWIKEINTANNK